MRLRCRRATGSEARCAVVINRRDRKLRAELQRKPSTFSSGLDCVAHGALIKNKAHKRLKYKYKVQIHKMGMGLRVAAAGSRIFSPGIKPSHLFSSSILQPSCSLLEAAEPHVRAGLLRNQPTHWAHTGPPWCFLCAPEARSRQPEW